MIRLSIQARQALAKLTLPVLIAAAFGLMLLGKADTLLAERARMALADALAPIYAALAEPLGRVRDTHRRRHRPVGHPRARTPACARRTSACAAGSRSRWRSTRRTSG